MAKKIGLEKKVLAALAALALAFGFMVMACDMEEDTGNPGDNPGNGDPVATAAVSFYSGTYSSGTDADLDAHSDAAWALTAGEHAAAYFGVTKEAAQTVTVSGADAAKVTAADNDGGSVSASGTLALFKVDTADCVFEGGARGFTLDVSEEGKTARTVAVNLRVAPDYTGAALFHVTAAGLERLDTAPAAANLLDAIKLFDTEAEDENEYLIRVEGDENLLPRIYFNREADYNQITLRLRGVTKNADGSAAGERVIKYDDALGNSGAGSYYTASGAFDSTSMSSSASEYGFFNFMKSKGFYQVTPGDIEDGAILFYLGNNITIQSHRLVSNEKYNQLFYIGANNYFTMEAGAKITGHDTSDHITPITSIFWIGQNGTTAKLTIKSGAVITGNVLSGATTNFGTAPYVVRYANNFAVEDATYAPFEKEAGTVITNNGTSFAGMSSDFKLDLDVEGSVFGYCEVEE